MLINEVSVLNIIIFSFYIKIKPKIQIILFTMR